MARPTAEQAQATRAIGYAESMSVPFMSGDLIPLLSGQSLLMDMKRMAMTDETVGAMMWCIESTLGAVKWKHKAQLDGVDVEDDAEATRLAAFADSLLLDMDQAFKEHVESALNMVWAGFAPHEIILKQRKPGQSRFDDRLYGIESLSYRDPLSIMGWKRTEDRKATVIGMEQSGAEGDIPMWKVCNYRTSAKSNNPEGQPLLLNAWRAWRLKNRIQDSEAIGIERDLCGLPVFRAPEELLEQANELDTDGKPTAAAMQAQARIQAGIKAVKDMRFNRSGGLYMPSDTFYEDTANGSSGDRTPKYDFKLVTTAGQRSIDTRAVARDYDRAIARVVMMQFLHLGDRSTGSYSLSDDQSSMALKSLQSLADKIALEFTRKALTLVWRVNGLDMRRLPWLSAGDITKEGLTAIGTFLRGVGAVADLWNTDPVARQSILTTTGFKFSREAQISGAAQAEKTAEALAQPKPALPAPGEEPDEDPPSR